ncbi:phage head closure protein [Bacillus sp. SCS-151]|uniref:phage head closure protein n=1 Tax=Nanhaiella sioensis TaxID=3115293 RepID=UPI00397BA88A
MNPGKLNKRIDILQQPDGQDSYGESDEIWNAIAHVWADVNPLRGRELYRAKQIHPEATYMFIIRYRPGISHDMRVRYGERLFEIVAPPLNDKEVNRYLEITCKEVF